MSNNPLNIPTGPAGEQAADRDPYSAPRPAAPTGFSNDGNRVTSVQLGHDGSAVARHQGVTRSDGEPSSPSASNGILAVVNPVTNSPMSVSQATEKSIVTVQMPGGSTAQMSLASALAAGFCSDPRVQAPHQPVQQQQAPVEPNAQEASEEASEGDEEALDVVDAAVEPLADEGAEETLSALVTATDPADQMAVVAQIAAGEEISPDLIARAASTSGLEPEQIEGAIEEVHAAMSQQADEVAEEYGFEPSDVWQWARAERPAEFSKAIQEHATLRTTDAYADLVEEFAKNLDTIAPHILLDSQFGEGTTVHQDREGRIILTTPDGTSMTWKAAVKAGIVSIGAAL